MEEKDIKGKTLKELLREDEETLRLEKRREELREKAIHDEVTRMEGAREEGMKLGMEQGIKEGIKLGIEKVKKQGKYDTARKMLKMNMDMSIIKKVTGLSDEDILKLKN